MDKLTNHDRFEKMFKDKSGQTLKTAEIKKILKKRFLDMNEGSMLPNDHAEGNKSPCSCAGTERKIFNRIERGLYSVR